tara:strand:- start:183 stop:353 length:171 start_codon:yes stop_codon:yes gene_type:complete
MTDTKSKSFIKDVFCCFKRFKREKIEDDLSEGEAASTINRRKNMPKLIKIDFDEEE